MLILRCNHFPENLIFLNSWVKFHCVCIETNKYVLCRYIWYVHICVWNFHYPFMNWWAARLVPFLHYHEYSRNKHGYASICVLGYRTLWEGAHEWLNCITWCVHLLCFYFLRTLHTSSPWFCISFHCPISEEVFLFPHILSTPVVLCFLDDSHFDWSGLNLSSSPNLHSPVG